MHKTIFRCIRPNIFLEAWRFPIISARQCYKPLPIKMKTLKSINQIFNTGIKARIKNRGGKRKKNSVGYCKRVTEQN